MGVMHSEKSYMPMPLLCMLALMSGVITEDNSVIQKEVAYLNTGYVRTGGESTYWLMAMEHERWIKVTRLELHPWALHLFWEKNDHLAPEIGDDESFEDYYKSLKALLEKHTTLIDIDEKLGLDTFTQLEGGIIVHFIPDKRRIKAELDEYIDKFDADLLHDSTAYHPWTYVRQKQYLDEIMASKSQLGGKNISLSAKDYRGKNDESNHCFLMPEAILSTARDKRIIIKMLGIDFDNLDDLKRGIFNAKVELTSDFSNVNLPFGSGKKAEAKIDGQQVYVGVHGQQLIPLGKPLRSNDAPYNFMHYMQSHTNRTISKLDIQDIPGCEHHEDMTELVRSSRFDAKLKKYFFNGTSRTQARFTPIKEISPEEYEDYLEILDTIREKTENNRKYLK